MAHLHDEKVKELELLANEIRQTVIKMLVDGVSNSGHTAGPLGMADIFALLYFHALQHDPKDPQWDQRDKVVLSNGHICPVLYATLIHAGYLKKSEIGNLRKFGSKLQGHPHREYLDLLETSSGPLGSGLSQAVGMAIADQIDHGVNARRYIYCLMSDGELNEGNSWEGAMLAGKRRLNNLIAIVDRNNIQIDGYTENVMPLEPLRKKWEAFNWHVLEIDGHNMQEINTAINAAKAIFERPTVILAHTVPGKGVSFMEGDYKWHGDPPGKIEDDDGPPKEKQAAEALHQLRTLGGKIKGEHE